MQSMSTIQGNLAALAKEHDTAQKKADKLKEKGAKANAGKVANATSSIDDANQQWESQAPYVFEQLQAADESRLNHLRDVLTQFQTHEVDLVERNRTSAESTLNALLSVETADEIKTFAAKISGGRTPVPSSAPRAPSAPPRERRQSSSTATPSLQVPPPASTPAQDDGASSVFGVSAGGRPRLAPPPVPESHRQSTFGGLKRLGTVMGRRKSSPQNALAMASEKPEKSKKSRPSFAPFRREGSSRSFQEVTSPSEGLTSMAPHEESLSPPRTQQTQVESQAAEMAAIAEVPSPKADQQPLTNGSALERTSSAGQPLDGVSALTANGFPPPIEPPSEPVAATPRTSTNPFDAINQAQREAAAANAYDMTPSFASPGSNAFHSENESALSGLTIRDKPIEEDQSEAQLAMNNMASQLRMSVSLRPQGSIRGRRDVRNTIFVPSNENPESVLSGVTTSPGPITESPVSSNTAPFAGGIKRTNTPGTIPEDSVLTSDANSIHSSQTAPSVAAASAHPEPQRPGLNASIIETVSTSMTSGAVTKSSVVGEVALSYNATPSSPTPGSTSVRLDNFQILEKVAANPSFVTPSTSNKGKETEEERAGQYQVTLNSITKPTPTVAFKYQLHLDDATLSAYSPIIFRPIWQIQDAQASVIINYSLNPLLHTQSLTLRNVLITVNIDTATDSSAPTKAINAMMAPPAGASFKRKQALVVWRLPEFTVTADGDAATKRLLARFITSGPKPAPGKVEAKWEVVRSASTATEGKTWVGSELGVSVLEAGGAVEVDPFADESAGAAASPAFGGEKWRQLGLTGEAKKVVSGRYSAN
ncbi:MAG: hypothetical protein Q9160_006255 [Pyrenula sp. 1 TL-2023]